MLKVAQAAAAVRMCGAVWQLRLPTLIRLRWGGKGREPDVVQGVNDAAMAAGEVRLRTQHLPKQTFVLLLIPPSSISWTGLLNIAGAAGRF